jgi:hypothetical protein
VLCVRCNFLLLCCLWCWYLVLGRSWVCCVWYWMCSLYSTYAVTAAFVACRIPSWDSGRGLQIKCCKFPFSHCYCFQYNNGLHGRSSIDRLLGNVDTWLPSYPASHPKRNSEPTILGVFQNEMHRGMWGPMQQNCTTRLICFWVKQGLSDENETSSRTVSGGFWHQSSSKTAAGKPAWGKANTCQAYLRTSPSFDATSVKKVQKQNYFLLHKEVISVVHS